MPLTRTTNAIAIVVAWGACRFCDGWKRRQLSARHRHNQDGFENQLHFATSLENPYHMTLRKSLNYATAWINL